MSREAYNSFEQVTQVPEEVAWMRLSVEILRTKHGRYNAQCPSLPGCRAQGPTREEALRGLDKAVRGYLAALTNFVPEHFDHTILKA